MNKKIRLTDIEALQAFIDMAEGKATQRCLSAQRLVRKVSEWERKVGSPPKRLLRGVMLDVQASGEKFPNAYKYTPMETVVSLNHDTVGWYVTCAERTAVMSHSWTVTATLPDKELGDRILEKALRC